MSAVMNPVEAMGDARSAVARVASIAPSATNLTPWLLRCLLMAGCIASVALAAMAGHPNGLQEADPELARLLRGMALIKASLVVAGFGALWWRSGHAVTAPTAIVYAMGLWLAAGASMSIWQLSHIAAAAGFFHLGVGVLLWTAWRDGRGAHVADASQS